jgi:hypothetical protein
MIKGISFFDEHLPDFALYFEYSGLPLFKCAKLFTIAKQKNSRTFRKFDV